PSITEDLEHRDSGVAGRGGPNELHFDVIGIAEEVELTGEQWRTPHLEGRAGYPRHLRAAVHPADPHDGPAVQVLLEEVDDDPRVRVGLEGAHHERLVQPEEEIAGRGHVVANRRARRARGEINLRGVEADIRR